MLGFFKKLEQIPDFADSAYTLDDVPKDDVEQAVLLAFLTRHYYPLSAEDATEYVEKQTTLAPSEGEVATALDNLVQQNLLTEDDGTYTLNKSSDFATVIQDARIQDKLDGEY